MTHEKANTYKELCAQADNVVKRKACTLPQGYEKLETSWDNKKTNFKAVAYTNGDEIVISYVGTDPKSIKDHGANWKMVLTGKNKQMEKADEFYDKIEEKYPGKKIIVAGHSEGGSEATHVAMKNNVEAVTFNAYGLGKQDGDYSDLITNYRDPNDPVSKLRQNPGKTYIVESTQSKFKQVTHLGAKEAHSIDKMGDCETALSVEEYKTQRDKNFVDNISEAEITREEIADMDTDLYEIYEQEIDKRMADNDLPSRAQAQEKTNSGGTVWVEDYTRGDGTKVSGYYRKAN